MCFDFFRLRWLTKLKLKGCPRGGMGVCLILHVGRGNNRRRRCSLTCGVSNASDVTCQKHAFVTEIS